MSARRRLPLALVAGLAILAVEVAVALAAGILYPGDPLDLVGPPLLWPGQEPGFPLGTDLMGRDIAAGLAHGVRGALTVGLGSMLIAVAIGTFMGLTAGYMGGPVDYLLMRIGELFQAIPHFLFAIVVIAILGPSLPNTIFAIGITSWTMLARLVRAETLLLRELDFVKASMAMGAGHARLLLAHVLPNVSVQIVTSASILTAVAILDEAGLAFVGLGDGNHASWGGMIGAARESLREAAFTCLLPGAAIIGTVLALSLLGRGLAQHFNPRAAA